VCNALSLKMSNMLAEVFFALIGTEVLNREACLVFNERLPGFEDLEDSFGRFIGNGVSPTITSEVVGESNKVTSISNGSGSNRTINIGVNEFEWPCGAVFVGDKRLTSLLSKEAEVALFWSVFNADSTESFCGNMTESFVSDLAFAD
jgi:hypothetical protein